MYQKGYSDEVIAKKIGVSRRTIGNYRKKYGIKTRSRGSWLLGNKRPKHSIFIKKWIKNNGHPMKGMSHKESTKKKMRESWSYEKIITPERNQKISETRKRKYGTKNKNKRYIKNLLRKSAVYRNWRNGVFERDKYTCQKCKVKGIYLEAHHIKSFNDFPELRYVISNGLTLCRKCHLKIA